MITWAQFAAAAPELAAFGKQRFESGVAYLGTVRADGSPRVHPVTPLIGAQQLYLFMYPSSPKAHDLQRDGRYTLHCGVGNSEGGEGEFYVSGTAALTADPALRAEAAVIRYTPRPEYILFVLSVQQAFMNVYETDGPSVKRWRAP